MNLFSLLQNVVWIVGFMVVIMGFNDLLPSIWYSKISSHELIQNIKMDSIAFTNLQFDERTHKLFMDYNESSLLNLTSSAYYTNFPNSLPSHQVEEYLYNTSGDQSIHFYESIDWYTLGFRTAMIFLFVQIGWMVFNSLFSITSGASESSPLGLMSQGLNPSGHYEEIENIDLRYDDVIGMEPIKEDLKLISTIFKYNFIFQRQGVKIPTGLLFSGPPGVGKTLMAKAFAGEANCKFYSISGADFKQPLVGMGGIIVKELFETAKQNAPAVIFIDEIDAVGQKRSMSVNSSTESSSTLNKILEQMDGFSTSDGIMVIGATNRPHILDSALTRTGRFDRKITFDLPNKNERTQLLNLYFKKIRLTNKFELFLDQHVTELARQSAGMSGSDISSLINQGVLNYDKELFFEKDDEDFSDSSDEDEPTEDNEDEPTEDNENEPTEDNEDENEDEDENEPTEDNEDEDDKKLEQIKNMMIRHQLKNISNEELTTKIIDGVEIMDDFLFHVLEEDEKNTNDSNIKLKSFLKKSMYREMNLQHFLKALNEIKVGIEKKERTMTLTEKKRVAYHEAGHALVAYLCKSTNPPIKITIIPHGEGSLGFTMIEPDERKMHLRSEVLAQVAVFLGGTVAERVFFGEPGTGASDDLKKATHILNNYISRYGMDDEFGLISFEMDDQSVPTEWKHKVYNKTNSILSIIKDKVHTAVENNKNHMIAMADFLLEHEEILEENVRKILPKEIENTLTISLT